MTNQDKARAWQRLKTAEAHITSAKTLLANARDLTGEGDLTNMCNASLCVAADNLRLLTNKILKCQPTTNAQA